MAKSTIILLFLLAFQHVSSTSFSNITNDSKPSNHGFSIKLIHRDSPESPIYRSNLTELQRTKSLILQSKARSEHLFGVSNKKLGFETEALKSKMEQGQNSVYLAQVGIGTFGSSTIPYFLYIETGNNLIWTQCQGCRSPGNHCFPQKQPVFPDSRSRTCHKLPCSRHPLCFIGMCLHDWCTYHVDFFHNSSSTTGFLATETFWFSGLNSLSGWETIPGIVFGCGFDQRNMGPDPYGGDAAGSMGLGWGPRSFTAQLGPRGHHRFSYCLQSPNSNATEVSFLRFGSNVESSTTDFKTTDILQTGFQAPYFLNLVGLSLGTRWLQIPTNVFFRRKHSLRSGTIIETGATFSLIVQPAYEILEQVVIDHLQSNISGLERVHISGTFKLCFKRAEPSTSPWLRGLPSMKFHFNHDDKMKVRPQTLFHLGGDQKELICLAVLPAPYDHDNGGLTLIGTYQQTNQHFIFDVGQKKLHFALENCSKNG